MSCPPCIAIAAGGTGGHLFPALALGRELSRRGYAPVLLTDARGMKLLQHGDLPQGWRQNQIISVPAATPYGKRGVGQYLRAAADILAGVTASWRVLARLQAHAAVGFGGYPSFAPLLAARLRNIPVCVHEQNAVLGRANRMLAPLARAIAFALPPSTYVRWSHYVVTGTPVREEALAAAVPYQAARPEEAFRLLVFGGSQGARVLSETLPEVLTLLPTTLQARLRITQQCRQEDIAALEHCYDKVEIDYEAAPFFADLPRRMSEAHLVLARAGASTIAELAVIGRPAILLPLPHSLDSDQEKNAAALTQAGGAWTLRETENLASDLARLLQTGMEQPQQLRQLADASRHFGRPDAVMRLADLVESLIKEGVHSERSRRMDSFRDDFHGMKLVPQ